MRPISRLRASFVLLLLWEAACHNRQATVPVPTPPAANQSASPAPPPATTNSQTPSPGAATTHAADSTPYQVNKPPQPAPASKKPVRSATAPAPTPAPAATTPATPAATPAPAPKLGDILTPDEQRQYSAAIDQSLAHAQTSLNAIGGRQLNKDQQTQVEQVRNFMQQAQSTRASDPAGAKSLAERAEVLARDLAASFH
jgi:hypothetical protein